MARSRARDPLATSVARYLSFRATRRLRPQLRGSTAPSSRTPLGKMRSAAFVVVAEASMLVWARRGHVGTRLPRRGAGEDGAADPRLAGDAAGAVGARAERHRRLSTHIALGSRPTSTAERAFECANAFSRFVLVLCVMPSTRERGRAGRVRECSVATGCRRPSRASRGVGGEEQDLRSRSRHRGAAEKPTPRWRRQLGHRPAGGRDDHGRWSAARRPCG